MWTPNDSEYKYYEVGAFIPALNRLIRLQKKEVPVLLDQSGITKYANSKGNTGVFTSVFAYAGTNIESKRISSMFFDLDSADLYTAQIEACKVIRYLAASIPDEAIKIYFTGSKGFHIEIEAVALGVSPVSNLADVFRFIGSTIIRRLNLITIDTKVWEPRRIWRLPNSKHQSTGLYKIELPYETVFSCSPDEIRQMAIQPKPLSDAPQILDTKANKWFTGFVEEYEAHLQAEATRRLETFLLYGPYRDKRDINDIIQPLLDAVEGERNDTLFKISCRVGRMVGTGKIDEDSATELLADAASHVGLDSHEIRATIQSGLSRGQRSVTIL